eukprot:7637663-Alexandrium_andersonii.AAC.1
MGARACVRACEYACLPAYLRACLPALYAGVHLCNPDDLATLMLSDGKYRSSTSVHSQAQRTAPVPVRTPAEEGRA